MWFWAWSRNAVIREIMDTMPNTSISNSSQEDSVAWTLTHVSWWRAIWFQRYVPRWAIIQWMATREKDADLGGDWHKLVCLLLSWPWETWAFVFWVSLLFPTLEANDVALTMCLDRLGNCRVLQKKCEAVASLEHLIATDLRYHVSSWRHIQRSTIKSDLML